MKRVFAGLLVLCLVLIAPMQAFAASWDIWFFDGDTECVDVSHTKASTGQKVTVKPKTGYKIVTIIVVPSDGDPLPLKQEGNGYSFIMPEGSVEMMVEVEGTNGGGAKHRVTVISAGNGNPTVDKPLAAKGEIVTVDPKPAAGIAFDHIQTDYYGDTGNMIENLDVPYFTMPDYDTTVIVYYKQVTDTPEVPEVPEVPAVTVTFDANGGACSVTSAKVNAAGKLASLPTPSRSGHIFLGWFFEKNDKTPVAKDTVYTQDITLYARWIRVDHVTDPDQNAFYADIKMDDDHVINLLVSQEDLQYMEDIVVYLDVKQLADEKVPAQDKENIINKAGEDMIAVYMDIQLLKKIGNREPVRISNTKGALPLTMKLTGIDIPQDATPNSYYIIYYHDGVAKAIPATFNTATKELSFSASEFSTYSLVYTTNVEPPVAPEPPKTGDNANLVLWTCLMLGAVVALVALKPKKA